MPQLAGSAALLDDFVAAVGSRRPVHVIEPPGAGGAASPRGVPSTRGLAKALLAEWERRRIGPAAVFGISLGGMIAQWVAALARDQVRALVLASTAPRGLDAARSADVRKAALARCLLRPKDEAMVCLVDGVLGEGLADEPEALAAVRETARGQARGRRTLLWLSAAAAAHDARDALAGLPTPTLVLSGADDPLVRPEAQAELLALLPRARHRIFEGRGHDLTLEAPNETAQAVLEFLAAL